MGKNLIILLSLFILVACSKSPPTNSTAIDSSLHTSGYEFVGGYPTEATIQKAYDEADFNRAIMAYRFFYPSVSICGTWKGNLKNGVVPNKVFAILDGTPQQLVFTPNSDTKYAGLLFDLREYGPMVIEGDGYWFTRSG
jgi:hypothetical protein